VKRLSDCGACTPSSDRCNTMRNVDAIRKMCFKMDSTMTADINDADGANERYAFTLLARAPAQASGQHCVWDDVLACMPTHHLSRGCFVSLQAQHGLTPSGGLSGYTKPDVTWWVADITSSQVAHVSLRVLLCDACARPLETIRHCHTPSADGGDTNHECMHIVNRNVGTVKRTTKGE
jgi:hypothetical protein